MFFIGIHLTIVLKFHREVVTDSVSRRAAKPLKPTLMALIINTKI